MQRLIEIYLTKNGYEIETTDSGEIAIEMLKAFTFDLVLLDVMMPKLNGWETCQKIRSFSDVPIIMLTARDQVMDKVKGLTIGADDYIVKPFEEMELLARIEAILRRTAKRTTEVKDQPDDTNQTLEHKGLRINVESYQVFYQGLEIELTPKEFQLLQTFLVNPGKVFSREKLLELIWGYDYLGDLRTVDSHVKNLREKLRSKGVPVDEILKTVWGVGYKFV
ncbi:DNA-binding response regulator [Desulfuribacillus stibiiarsenatis]|uniref:DNA-binding response regulator n=2 Tax=Desulfuribacillus stibiiarsenatis TaxID=1390249 RepID=A0A1E5L973_9FIRM|nr:DNA-binding response regulator [Desulfuribacillus stibiiarsenatis]